MPDVRDLCNKADEIIEQDQLDEELDLLNRAIKLEGNNANTWYNQGEYFFNFKALCATSKEFSEHSLRKSFFFEQG